MARRARPWTCRKKSCRAVNPVGTRKCQTCGKPRPSKKDRQPDHMTVLDVLSYADFTEINGGEFCFVCQQLPPHRRIKTTVRYNRDHEHVGFGMPRGLLCNIHNQRLGDMDLEEAYAYVAFLERAKSKSFLAKVKRFWPKN